MEYVKQSMNQVWASAGDVVMPDNAKIQEGWLVEVPPRQYWNWMQNRADTNLAYIFQRGIPEWDNTVEYIANKSFVVYNGVTYKAILTGTNKNPSTATTYWQRAFASYTTALNAIGSVTPDTDKYVYFTSSSAATTGTITSFARSILDDATAGDVRTTIGAQQADATLTAIADLTTAANKLPYFTGTDTAALTDLTAFARGLLDDNTASDARTTLGLGSAATATVTTSVTDTTANRLLKVGDFGVGRVVSFSGADLNTLVDSGFYYASNASPVNYPGGYNSGSVIVSGGGFSNVHTQVFFPVAAREKSYFRTYYTSWGDWQEVVTGVKQTNTTDSTSGSILTVGAFGLGATGVAYPSTNLNDLAPSGLYFTGTSDVSSPQPSAALALLNIRINATNGVQIASRQSADITWIRRQNSGTWGSWVQLWHGGNFNPATKANVNNATFTGSFSVGNALNISNLAGGIEVGRTDGVAGTAYVDLHAGATVTDYDARLQCTSGNGTTGQGTVSLAGGTIDLQAGTGACILRHANTVRLTTTSTGVSITGNLTADDSGYLTPSFVNGHFDNNLFRYRRNNGYVSITGAISRTTPWQVNTTLFTLPVGYRPATSVSQTMLVSYSDLSTQSMQIVINPSGVVATVFGFITSGTPSGQGDAIFDIVFPV